MAHVSISYVAQIKNISHTHCWFKSAIGVHYIFDMYTYVYFHVYMYIYIHITMFFQNCVSLLKKERVYHLPEKLQCGQIALPVMFSTHSN